MDISALESDGFGHWLAGFIDGEGTFEIKGGTSARAGYSCRFALEIRGDDAAILAECQQRLDIGSIIDVSLRPDRPANPSKRWCVYSKAECQTLVAFLERFPLRSKKLRDFVIWRDAVAAWGGLRACGNTASDWSEVARLKSAITEGRRYVPVG